MANQEHLDILKQGVEVWNQWRVENREVEPDLSDAKLTGADLRNAILSKTDFIEADLSGADLSNVDLNGAILIFAYLRNANLSSAQISGAFLNGADLSGANLSRANLSGAELDDINLSEANLSRAQLREAILNNGHLSGADLSSADLRRAHLGGADLSNADLRNADLSSVQLHDVVLRGADLRGVNLNGKNLSGLDLSGTALSDARLDCADLTDASLTGANLQRASLQATRLIDAKLDGANITDACLWQTQCAGWSIKGVICESIYWDKEAKEKTVYNPGEFERLFADKTRIKLLFRDGITPLEIATLPALIKHLQNEHPGCSLRFVSISDDTGGAVVELAIEAPEESSTDEVRQLQTALQPKAQEKVEELRAVFAEKSALVQLENKFEQLYAVVHQSLQQPKQLTTIHVNEGGHVGDKYEISGQAGAVGPNAHVHDNTFNQTINYVQHIDLAELTKQIVELRQAIIQKQDASPEAGLAIGKITEAQLAASQQNTSQVIEHLQAAGNWALEFAKAQGKDLVVEAIQYHSVFISYSSRNQDIAERLYADLQSQGVHCWFAPEDIKIGDKFRQRIDEAIHVHDKLLLILSEDSMASNWVEVEVEAAFEREHRENRLVLFPIRIDDAVGQSNTAWAASLRRMRHIGDFSNWKDHDSYSKAFDRLLRDLKADDKA